METLFCSVKNAPVVSTSNLHLNYNMQLVQVYSANNRDSFHSENFFHLLELQISRERKIWHF